MSSFGALLTLLHLACAPPSTAPSVRQIALSFDDAPLSDSERFTGAERARAIVTALQQAKAPQVAFFVNTKRMRGEGLQRVKYYAASGHLLANHSHSHPDFNRTSLAN